MCTCNFRINKVLQQSVVIDQRSSLKAFIWCIDNGSNACSTEVFEYPESLLLLIFHACRKKGSWKLPIPIFIKLYWNAVALLFSNITFDSIEDYIPHYVPMIC